MFTCSLLLLCKPAPYSFYVALPSTPSILTCTLLLLCLPALYTFYFHLHPTLSMFTCTLLLLCKPLPYSFYVHLHSTPSMFTGTVSQELAQPTPRILHVFTSGIFLCQPYTPEYAFRCIPSIGFLVVFGSYRLLNFSNRMHHCGRET